MADHLKSVGEAFICPCHCLSWWGFIVPPLQVVSGENVQGFHMLAGATANVICQWSNDPDYEKRPLPFTGGFPGEERRMDKHLVSYLENMDLGLL